MLAACWLAVLKAGGVAVTTMPLYRANELRFMMEKAQVKHALCDVRLRDELERAAASTAACGRCTSARRKRPNRSSGAWRASPAEFANVETAAEDVAIIAFTSGTTGNAESGDALSSRSAGDLRHVCGRTCCSRGATISSAEARRSAFTFGLGGLLLFPLYAGAATVLLEKAGPVELLERSRRFGVTTLFTAPIAYRTMSARSRAFDICDVADVRVGRRDAAAGVWEEWHAKTGLRILDGIGSTEMLHIFIGSPRRRSRARDRPGAPCRATSPRSTTTTDGRCRDGTIGRLAVKGPTGCKYLNDERQSHTCSDGWNYPGDAYRRDADGYFWYVARTDDMIVSAGYNISGPEVEQALHRCTPTSTSSRSSPSPIRRSDTHIVKAFVVLADGCAGRRRESRRAARVLQGADRAVQGAARDRVRRRAAAHGNRQASALQTALLSSNVRSGDAERFAVEPLVAPPSVAALVGPSFSGKAFRVAATYVGRFERVCRRCARG